MNVFIPQITCGMLVCRWCSALCNSYTRASWSSGFWESVCLSMHCVVIVRLRMASYAYSWESPFPIDVYRQFSVNNFYGYAPLFEEQRQPSTTHEDPEVSKGFNSRSSGGACEEKEVVSTL